MEIENPLLCAIFPFHPRTTNTKVLCIFVPTSDNEPSAHRCMGQARGLQEIYSAHRAFFPLIMWLDCPQDLGLLSNGARSSHRFKGKAQLLADQRGNYYRTNGWKTASPGSTAELQERNRWSFSSGNRSACHLVPPVPLLLILLRFQRNWTNLALGDGGIPIRRYLHGWTWRT